MQVKAFKIFEATEESFETDQIIWNNCASLSVDNANAMVGKQNSVCSIKISAENPKCLTEGEDAGKGF